VCGTLTPNPYRFQGSGFSVQRLELWVSGDTTPCRMTGVTLHGVVSPEG